MTVREQILANVRRMGLARAYEVGGAVRDHDPKDVDIAVVGMTFEALLAACRDEGSALPLVVARQPIGVRLVAGWTPREGVEFALARTEVSTGASRHQFAIRAHPGVTIEQDLARRDFTVNAMARDVGTGALIDPFGGAEDLRAGVLRTVSERSFPEDPLRVLRGLVRCAKDELTPEPATFEHMREWGEDPRRYLREHVDELVLAALGGGEAAAVRVDPARDAVLAALLASDVDPRSVDAVRAWALAAVDDPAARPALEAVTGYRWYGDIPLSPERVWQELRKLLAARHAAHALRIARATGVLTRILPELADTIGFDQRSRYHDMTVDEHTLEVLGHACAIGAPETVKLAALLHDSGKPESAWSRPGEANLHFYANPEGGRAHEEIGAERARAALARLAAPTEVRDKVSRLVREHMYGDDDGFLELSAPTRERRARRFIRRVGTENVEELMLLRRCDRAGKRETPPPGWDAEPAAFEAAVRAELENGAAVGVNDLAVDGRDLAAAGMTGRAIGEAKRRLLEIVIEYPDANTPERLMTIAREIHDEIQAAADTAEAAERAASAARRAAALAAARASRDGSAPPRPTREP